jgi:hypothetical protein
MAMNDDIIYPHLTPLNDRYPSHGNLNRSAGDLTAEQFDLLAAAWAENALSDEGLAEIEALFAIDKSKETYAGSFRQLRLVPCDDRWEGLNGLLQTTPAARTIRRVFIIALASAAIFFTLFTLKPLVKKQVTLTAPITLPEVAVISDVTEPAAPDISNKMEETVSASTTPAAKEKSKALHHPFRESTARTSPVTMIASAETPSLISGITSRELRPVRFNVITAAPDIPDDENWIVRGISRLSRASAKERKPIDAYVVASAFIKGINSVLGSEIALDRTLNKKGDLVAVSFSSSLLSIKAPVKKNSPRL